MNMSPKCMFLRNSPEHVPSSIVTTNQQTPSVNMFRVQHTSECLIRAVCEAFGI
jgi:hypothetical protein